MSAGAAQELRLIVSADAGGILAIETAFGKLASSIQGNLGTLAQVMDRVANAGSTDFGKLEAALKKATGELQNATQVIASQKTAIEGNAAAFKQAVAEEVAGIKKTTAERQAESAEKKRLIAEDRAYKKAAVAQERADNKALLAAQSADEAAAGRALKDVKTLWIAEAKTRDAELLAGQRNDNAATLALAKKATADRLLVEKAAAEQQVAIERAKAAEILVVQKAMAAESAAIANLRNKAALGQHYNITLPLGAASPIASAAPIAAPIAAVTAETKALAAASLAAGAAAAGAVSPTKQLAEANRELHSAARGAAGSMGMLWTTYGSLAPLIAFAALGSALGAVIKQGKDFEFQMVFVKAITGETSEAMKGFNRDVVAIASQSMFSSVEAAKGLRELAQAGLSAVQAIAALPAVLQLAAVGEMEVSAAALTLTSVMNAFDLGMGNINYIGDVFAKAAAISTTSVSAMTRSMKQASVVADLFKVSIEDTATAMVILAKRGITDGPAGTAFRNMISELAAPTEKTAKLLDMLGFSAYDAGKNLKSLEVLAGDFQKAISGYDKPGQISLIEGIFGKKGDKAIAAMMADLKDMPGIMKQIANSSGFLGEVNRELLGTVTGELKRAYNALGAEFQKAFEQSSGALKNFATDLRKAIEGSGLAENLVAIGGALLKVTTLIVEHHKVILIAGGAYLLLSLGLSALTLLKTTYAAATTVATVATVASTAATVASTAAVAGANVAAATGVGTIAKYIALINPWARLLLGVGAAATLTWAALSGGEDATKIAIKNSQDYVKALDVELIRLERRAELIAKGVDPDSKAAEHSSARERLVADISKLEKEVTLRKIALENVPYGLGVQKRTAESRVTEVQAELNKLVADLDKADGLTKRIADSQKNEKIKADAAKAKKDKETLEASPFGPKTYSPLDGKKQAEADAYARAVLDNEVKVIEASRKLKDTQAQVELAELRNLHTAKIISDDEYSKKLFDLTAKRAEGNIKALKDEAAAYMKTAAEKGTGTAEGLKAETNAVEKLSAAEEAGAKQRMAVNEEYAKQMAANVGPSLTALETAQKSVLTSKEEYEALLSTNKALKDKAVIHTTTAIEMAQAKAAALVESIPRTALEGGEEAKLDFMRRELALLEETIIKLRAVREAQLGIAVKKDALQNPFWQAAEDAAKAAKAADAFGDSAAAAFGKAGTALGALAKSMTNYGSAVVEINKKQQVDTIKNPAEASKIAEAAAKSRASAEIKAYGDMAGAAKGFFKENSTGYQAMEAAERTFRLFQLAMDAQVLFTKLFSTGAITTAHVTGEALKQTATVAGTEVQLATDVVKAQSAAVVAVATQGEGDPYTAFVRMAAMAALLAGLGIAISGGGGSPNTDAVDRQKANGTGSVFGDSSAKSNSIKNSIDSLGNLSIIGNETTSAMLRALRSIDRNISGLGALVVRSATLTGKDTSNINLETTSNLPGIFKSLMFAGTAGSLLAAIFGKTTRSLVDSGIQFNSQSVGQARDGINAQGYSSVESKSSSLFGLIKRTSVSQEYASLNAEIANQFTLIIRSMYDSILAVTKVFGSDPAVIGGLLDALQIDTSKISFKDLKGDEIQKALESYFSKLGDDMAKAAFPELSKFQKIGEGMLQTLMRLGQEFAATDAIAKLLGKDVATAFGAVGVASIEARTSLVELMGGIDKMSESVLNYYDLFYSDAEKQVRASEMLSGQFKDLNVAMPKTNAEFRDLVEAQDLTTEAGRTLFAALIALAPAFDAAQKDAVAIADALASITDAIRALASESYDFAVAIGGKINSVGGKRDLGGMAMDRANDIRGSLSGMKTPGERMGGIKDYVGAIDSWYADRAAKINANAQAQATAASAASQAMANAQKSAIEARVNALTKELDLAKQMASIAERAANMMKSITLSGANPMHDFAKLVDAQGFTQKSRQAFLASSGDGRAKAANTYLDDLQAQLKSLETTYQRPSKEYLDGYNDIMRQLTEVEGIAQSESAQQLILTAKIVELQASANAIAAQTFTAADFAGGALAELNQEALAYYEFSEAYFKEQAKLQALDLEQQQQALLDQVTWLKAIHDKLPDPVPPPPPPAPIIVNVEVDANSNITSDEIVDAIIASGPRIRRELSLS